MYAFHWLQLGGLADAFGQVVVGAGAVVLLLMVLALGGFAYKSLRGGVEWPDDRDEDGVEWPDDRDEDGVGKDGDGDQDGVSRGGDDDEWEFY